MILSRPTDRTKWLKKYLKIRKNANKIIIIRNFDKKVNIRKKGKL